MRKPLSLIACVWLALGLLGRAQTVINGGRSVVGPWDASTAVSTRPAKAGTALPPTCTVGEQFFKTDETAGQNLYFCTATNTWTKMAGVGSGSMPGGATDGAIQYKSGPNFAGSDKLLWTDAESRIGLGTGVAGRGVEISNPNWRALQNYGVALVRSATPGKVTALDVLPSSSNPDDAEVGFKHAWIDICNQDLITDGWGAGWSCLSMRTSPLWLMIGTSQSGAYAADEIEMQIKSTKGVSLWGGNDGAGNSYKLFETKKDSTHDYVYALSPLTGAYTWSLATYDNARYQTLYNDMVLQWVPSGGTDQFWTADAGIKRLGAASLGVTKGWTSTQYGDWTVRSLRLNPNSDTKPACDATQRGKIWVIYGGAGVADTAEICRKAADDSYSWTALY